VRVLLSGYTCDPNGGSESANTWYTALELVRAGVTVHLLTRESDRGAVEAALSGVGHLNGDLQVSFLSDQSPLRGLVRGQAGVYGRYHEFQKRVRAWARGRSFDVGHHVSWGSINHPVGLAGAVQPLVIGPAGGGQELSTELTQWVDGPVRNELLRNILLSDRALGVRRAARDLRKADLVLTTNWETEAHVHRIGTVRSSGIVPDGVRSMPTPTTFRADPTVVWIGRLLPIKGVRLALEGFRHALRSAPGARLIVVGDGPLADDLRRWSADLVANGSVELRGRLEWGDAQRVLRSARIHLFTGVRDSFSAQTLEAAAHGVPTVALDQFGLRRFCHRPGFELVSPSPGGDLPVRLGEALSAALSWSQDQWTLQSRGAREFAAENTYAEHAQTYLKLYRMLVGDRGAEAS
jgi:glycosyltransferase involved in cell wall biosynthesis